MRFYHLVNNLDNDAIVDRLVELYPDQNRKKQKAGYKKALEEIKSLKPEKYNLRIVLRDFEEEGEKWTRVSGIEAGESYAIEFTPWRQWLGMIVSSKTVKKYSQLDIVAHALWEMTWSGFSEKQVKERADELFDTVKDIKELNSYGA